MVCFGKFWLFLSVILHFLQNRDFVSVWEDFEGDDGFFDGDTVGDGAKVGLGAELVDEEVFDSGFGGEVVTEVEDFEEVGLAVGEVGLADEVGDAGVEFVEGGVGEVLLAVIVGAIAGGRGVVVCVPGVGLAHSFVRAEEIDVGGLVVWAAVGNRVVMGDIDVIGLTIEPDQVPGHGRPLRRSRVIRVTGMPSFWVMSWKDWA